MNVRMLSRHVMHVYMECSDGAGGYAIYLTIWSSGKAERRIKEFGA